MITDSIPTDRVLVNLDDTNPARDDIFTIDDGGTKSVLVKHVRVVRGGIEGAHSMHIEQPGQ